MARMTMVAALNRAMDEALRDDESVVLLGTLGLGEGKACAPSRSNS